jgi:hypothetical protein
MYCLVSWYYSIILNNKKEGCCHLATLGRKGTKNFKTCILPSIVKITLLRGGILCASFLSFCYCHDVTICMYFTYIFLLSVAMHECILILPSSIFSFIRFFLLSLLFSKDFFFSITF